jgi:recombination protein RecR
MANYPAPLARLIKGLSRLPGIGEKTAARLAFYMLKEKAEDMQELAESITRLAQSSVCATRADSRVDPSRPTTRNARLPDARRERRFASWEGGKKMRVKIAEYKGLYVLHGTISPLDGAGPTRSRSKLLERLGAGVREVIVATNPTVSEARPHYLSRRSRAG